MINLIRPNILILAILAVGLAGYIGSEPLASTVIMALATTMYLLGGPPPNPSVSKDFALAVVSGETGAKTSVSNAREQVVLYLVSIATAMTVGMSWFGLMSDRITEIAVGGIIGIIGSAIGSILEPSDEASVPQSTLFKVLEMQSKSAKK